MSEINYLNLLRDILTNGKKRTDRTGTGTIGVFGRQVRYDLRESIPVFTTKQIHWKSVVNELLWFLSGRTDNQWLQANGVRIWNEWATKDACAKFNRKEGDLGPIYGHQWRHFGAHYDGPKGSPSEYLEPNGDVREGAPIEYRGFDQIKWVIDEIKKNPDSRRLIVTGWNPVDARVVALPPCHTMFQFYVQDGELSCQLYQRSGDAFLGIPFNVASYAVLTHMVAHVCGLKPGDFVHTIGDAHIYSNHIAQVDEQLIRDPYKLPTLKFARRVTDIDDFKFEDLVLENYKAHPKIAAKVAV